MLQLRYVAPFLAASALVLGAPALMAQPVEMPSQFLASPAEAECVPHLLLCGQIAISELTREDCASGGGFLDLWFYPLQARQPFIVVAVSQDFDTFLRILDPTPRVVASNDDISPGDTNSGLALTSNRAGLWAAAVSAFADVGTGTYGIGLSCQGACVPDSNTLCLNNRRFRVQLSWFNQFNQQVGYGRAIARTSQAGFFSFGDPSNIELMVKILNFGDSFKVFYGQLTNLRFQMQVTDTVTGRSKTYTNTTGDCGSIDSEGFPIPARGVAAGLSPRAACRSSRNALCLLSNRFQVEVDWRNQFDGSSGRGSAVSLSSVTGAFYFTDPSNLELMVKVLPFPDRVAVFYGTLSNLEYTIRVTDMQTGAVRTYHNEPGSYCGGLDNAAF
jgi:hypothetical protein